jgi:hypothetical protein
MGEYIDKRLLERMCKLITSLRKGQLHAVQQYVLLDSLPLRIKSLLIIFVLTCLTQIHFCSWSIVLTLVVYYDSLSKRGRYIRHCMDIAGGLPSLATQPTDCSNLTINPKRKETTSCNTCEGYRYAGWAFITLLTKRAR